MYVLFASVGFAMALFVLWLTGNISVGKDAPAWVQAIGSIVAILIAIAVPAAQHFLSDRKQRLESEDRARSLALLLLPSIQDFSARNNRVWSAESPAGGVEEFGEVGCIVGPLAENALDIPAAITAVVTRIHELGPAAEGVQRAIYCITRARALVTSANTYSRGVATVRTVAIDKVEFYQLLWDAKKGLNRSEALIRALFATSRDPRQPQPAE
ncbi:hypothetical protein J0L38_00975 [Stenotrophomonas maltophilia]|nr:hypothetical protein [Stenotrophomonas maltophilia]